MSKKSTQLAFAFLAMVMPLLAVAAETATDGFHLNRAYIETSVLNSSVTDNAGPFVGVPNNLGSSHANAISAGLGANLLPKLRAGLSVTGMHSEGQSKDVFFDIGNKSNLYGAAGYLDYSIAKPVSVGVFGGRYHGGGDLTHTFGGMPTDRSNYSVTSINHGAYLTAVWPISSAWVARISPAYVQSRSTTDYSPLQGIIVSDSRANNRLDLLNVTASMSYFYARKWRFDVGAVMHHVKRQESSSPTTTLHSTNWQTPFVGVTYQLSKHYEVYGRVTKETHDDLFAGNTATLGFARNF